MTIEHPQAVKPVSDAGQAPVPNHLPSAGARSPGRRRLILMAAGVWAATRLVYAVLTYVSLVFAANQPSSARAVLLAWDIWDATWYQLISRVGYASIETTAFFPLYPMLIRGVSVVLGHGSGPIPPDQDVVRVAVAMALANLGALLAFIGLALLADHESGGADGDFARRTVVLLAAYPFAFYLAAGYAEGFFLAEAVFALYFARRARWLPALVAALLAGLTRPTGVALALPLLWEFGRHHGWWQRDRAPRDLRPGSLAVGLLVAGSTLLGTGIYAAYLWSRFGTPLVWLHVQGSGWHRVTAPLWITALRLAHRAVSGPIFSPPKAALLLQLLPLLLLLAALAFGLARKLPMAFSLYLAGVAYLAVAAPVVQQYELIVSAGRYVLIAFPMFLILSGWLRSRPSLELAWVGGGFALQAILLGVFLRGGWVA